MIHESILVLRHEIYTAIHRRSFQWMVFWLPLLTIALFGMVSLLRRPPDQPQTLPSGLPLASDLEPQDAELPDGFVDQGSLISQLPPGITPAQLLRFPGMVSARQALSQDQIRGIYLVPLDYVAQGEITYYQQEFNPFAALTNAGLIDRVMQFNLLRDDPQIQQRLAQPLALQITLLEPAALNRDQPLGFLLPYTLTFLLYLAILMSAGLLLSSLQKERENRVLEILLSCLDPQRLFYGKITGLGLVGLLQTLIWLGTSYTLLRLSGRSLRIPSEMLPQIDFLLWTAAFFLLGYLLYSSLMAAIGALVPNLREASQLTLLVNIPLMVTLLASIILIELPDHPLSVFLSFFPLTSPLGMVTRLSVADLPVWQPTLALLLLFAANLWVIRLTASLFRAQTLLQGQSFSWQRLGTWMRPNRRASVAIPGSASSTRGRRE